MRSFLLGAFVVACASALFLWQDNRSVSYEILLALPLLLIALPKRTASGPNANKRLTLGIALSVIVVANILLVALGSIPWYAGVLALPVVILGLREWRSLAVSLPQARDAVGS